MSPCKRTVSGSNPWVARRRLVSGVSARSVNCRLFARVPARRTRTHTLRERFVSFRGDVRFWERSGSGVAPLGAVRSGFSADALRWFCGPDGRVVVEQEARWSDVESGALLGRAHVASQFVVSDRIVAYYQRHDSLARALAAAGLDTTAEVTSR